MMFQVERVHVSGQRHRLTTEPMPFPTADKWAETYAASHPGACVEVVPQVPPLYMVEQDTPLGWVPVGPMGLNEAAAHLACRRLGADNGESDFRVVPVKYLDEKTDEALRVHPGTASRRVVSGCHAQQAEAAKARPAKTVEYLTLKYLGQAVTGLLADAESLRQSANISEDESVILTAEWYVRDETPKAIRSGSAPDPKGSMADWVARGKAQRILLYYLTAQGRAWRVTG